jgi:serine/threonine-protein kinase
MRAGMDDPADRQRFLREARSIGQLQHPNIVVLYDVGEHAGEPFIAMEYVNGRTLGDIMRQGGASLTDKIKWMEGICAGLFAAHRAGLIHRDIKPANVMVSGDGTVKVLDFGIARIDSATTGTVSGSIAGTLAYMSPEQFAGAPLDYRTDIFSAGALFHELLSGRAAFPGDVQQRMVQLAVDAGPPSLRSVVPALDPELVSLVERCLARRADARYPDFGAVLNDLAVIADRIGPVRPASGRFDSTYRLTPANTNETIVQSASAAQPSAAPSGSRRRMSIVAMAAIAAGVIATMSAGFFLARGWPSRHEPVNPTTPVVPLQADASSRQPQSSPPPPAPAPTPTLSDPATATRPASCTRRGVA